MSVSVQVLVGKIMHSLPLSLSHIDERIDTYINIYEKGRRIQATIISIRCMHVCILRRQEQGEGDDHLAWTTALRYSTRPV